MAKTGKFRMIVMVFTVAAAMVCMITAAGLAEYRQPESSQSQGTTSGGGQAQDVNSVQTVDKATSAVQNIFNRSDGRIPPEVIKNAKAVAIFPEVTKAGLIVGGSYGTGILMMKQNNEWNGPLFLSLYGGSIGAQIGAEQSDLLMVFNTDKALQQLQDGSLQFGAEATVAAGPYGEKEAVSTADIVAYQQTKGGFVGVSLSSGYLKFNPDADNQYYQSGKEGTRAYYPSAEEMISGKKAPQTQQADQLTQVLDQYANQSGQQGAPATK